MYLKECRACRMRVDENVSTCPRCFGLQFKHIENEMEHKIPREVTKNIVLKQQCKELRPNQGTVAISKINYVPITKQEDNEVLDVDEFEYETKDYFFIQLRMAIPIYNLVYVISRLSSMNTPIHIKCLIKSRLIMSAISLSIWLIIAVLAATVFKETIYSLY